MSVDAPFERILSPDVGGYESSPPYPLYTDYEKLKFELGFIEPEGSEQILAERHDMDEKSFDTMIRQYVDACMAHYQPRQADNWDIREFRGIFVSVSQLYFERYCKPGLPHDANYRAKMHECKHYLRTVDEDLHWHQEPANPHLDRLLLELKVDLPNLPKPKPIRFNTNIIDILSRIDPNLAALNFTQSKTAP